MLACGKKSFMLGAMKFLRLSFIPQSADLALLVLRLSLGLSMLILHGSYNLTGFKAKAASFPDPLGLGSQLSLALVTFAEVGCAALLIAGFLTRFASLVLAFNMSVAFFMVHKAAFSGPNSGELAFLYLTGFVAILLGGSGKFAFERE